ncbi:hypothetical protein BDQ17DRAFT_1248359, partial [Cyathus striatus]
EYEPLMKQTYSVFVLPPTDRGIKCKWHLTAYFSLTKVDELDTIDNIPGVGDVIVSDRWFESARGKKVRHDSQAQGTSPEIRPYPSSPYGNQMKSSIHPIVPFEYLQSVSGLCGSQSGWPSTNETNLVETNDDIDDDSITFSFIAHKGRRKEANG